MAIRTVTAIVIGALWLTSCATRAPEPIVAPPLPPPAAAPAPQSAPAPARPAPAPVEPATSAPGAASVTVIAPDKPTPPGDTRSVAERREDRQAFDRCVIKAQAQLDKRGPSAITQSPEEICYRQMGMRDRRDVPMSKQ
ncbi:MAG: hypothetical protein ACOYJ6_18120 [Caulobacterales bacterium]